MPGGRVTIASLLAATAAGVPLNPDLAAEVHTLIKALKENMEPALTKASEGVVALNQKVSNLAGAPQYGLDQYLSQGNFKVEVDGMEIENTKFVRVAGINSESEVLEVTQGDDKHKMFQPGKTSFGKVELTRVYNQVDHFYRWRKNIERGTVERRNVVVHMMLPDHETTARKIMLHECFPSKWEFPELFAGTVGAPASSHGTGQSLGTSEPPAVALEKSTLTCSWVTEA